MRLTSITALLALLLTTSLASGAEAPNSQNEIEKLRLDAAKYQTISKELETVKGNTSALALQLEALRAEKRELAKQYESLVLENARLTAQLEKLQATPSPPVEQVLPDGGSATLPAPEATAPEVEQPAAGTATEQPQDMPPQTTEEPAPPADPIPGYPAPESRSTAPEQQEPPQPLPNQDGI